MGCRCAAADCVLIWNNKIVLVRRGSEPEKGKLALPGGFVEIGETFREACIREAKEETNLDVEIIREIGVFDSPDRDERGCISVAFLCLGRGEPKADDDADDIVLVDIEEAMELAKNGELAFDHSDILLSGLSSKRIEIAVKGFVFRDGKVLVLKQHVLGRDVWDLPGGRIKHGETPEESLEREVLEETGIRISHTSLAGWTSFYRFDGSQTICLVFFAQYDGEEKAENPDKAEIISHVGWMDVQEFLGIDEDNEYISRLKSILRKHWNRDTSQQVVD